MLADFQDTAYQDAAHVSNYCTKECLYFNRLTLYTMSNVHKSDVLCCFTLVLFPDDGSLRTETCRDTMCDFVM